MARVRDPFGSALTRLRADLRDGRIRPGEPLITAELAQSLNISATPVREAISRLAGEGLLEDRRGRGVYAVAYAAEDVETLYRLHEAYVRVALESGSWSGSGEALELAGSPFRTAAHGLREQTERFWVALVRRDGGRAILLRHQRLADQLALLRLVEPQVVPGLAGELQELTRLAMATREAALSSAVADYHERRQAQARNLAAAARDYRPPPQI